MKFKIYTLQHQKLYEQIHSCECDEVSLKVLNKELGYLQNKCKELREDFSLLSKARELDALFTDVMLINKKKVYSYEHIIVHSNKIFVVERKKNYDNQKQLLKEKASYLQRLLGKHIPVDFYIIIEGKGHKDKCISMDNLIKMCLKEKANDGVSHKVNALILEKHASINIAEYIKKKHSIDILQKKSERKSGWAKVIGIKNPLVSKYKGTLPMLGSAIVFFYFLITCFSYSIFAKEKLFGLTIALDIFFLVVLVNILKEMEYRLPKFLKIITQLIILGGFVILFGRTIMHI